MKFLVTTAFVACIVISSVQCASNTWCYHLPTCNDAVWPAIAPQYCDGTRQSPINIVPSDAKFDPDLTEFTFHNFDSKSALRRMKNTGQTVMVSFGSGVQISGGGLSEPYDSVQFHLHWGNGAAHPGSEHTVDGKRYSMELHIVGIKSSYKGNITQAIADPTGLSALGFFIEATSDDEIEEPASWKMLTSYLTSISYKNDYVLMEPGISLDDLLDGVDRKNYYRYLGSLTTPNCNEAVVWTVFKEPIKVSKNLIDLFSTTVHISDSSSPFMINNYRNIQPMQPVMTN